MTTPARQRLVWLAGAGLSFAGAGLFHAISSGRIPVPASMRPWLLLAALGASFAGLFSIALRTRHDARRRARDASRIG